MELVRIEWVDSYGAGSAWEPTDNLVDEYHICVSVGYLALDGEKVKIIIPHLSPANEKIGAEEQGCGDMAIPVVSIIKMTSLVEQSLDHSARKHEEKSNADI